MIDRPTNAIPVIALSAIGSAILPKFVIRLCLRARSPSILSVIMANTNSPYASQRQPLLSPPSCSSAQPKNGTITMRRVVRALGTFQLLCCGSVNVPPSDRLCTVLVDLLRNEVDALGGGDDRLDHVTHPDIAGQPGQGGGPVDLRTLAGGASLSGTRSVLVEGLHQHHDALADPLLGPLRGQLLDQPGQVLDPFLDLVGVQLVGVRLGLGAVLVGVPEDPDRVQAGLADEVAQGLEVGSGLAREPDDEVGPYTGRRGVLADLGQQVAEGLG